MLLMFKNFTRTVDSPHIWIDFGLPLRAPHTPVQPATTTLGRGRQSK